MPQIWLTHEEAGAFLDRMPAEFRNTAHATPIARRRCRDGLIRLKLSPTMAHDYMHFYAASMSGAGDTDPQVAELRGILAAANPVTVEGPARRSAA